MSKSFDEVKSAIEVLLDIDPNAQVKVINQEWCYGTNDYIYVYDGSGWYESYSVEDYTKVEVDRGFVQMFDDHSHCGGYTTLVPHSLEITYEHFKIMYAQGSI